MRKTEEDQAAKLLRYGVGIVLGGAAALAVCLLFLLAASVLISRGLLADGLTYQLSIVGCVVGAFAGGMLAVRRCGRRTLIVGLCTGAVLFLLLLTVGVLFFETMSVEQGGIGLLCGGLCGGAAAGLLGYAIILLNHLLWEGNQNEACEDAQRRDSEKQRRPRRLRRVPDLLPVRL